MATATVNYWPDNQCAKAFWNQYEMPPYQALLKHTTRWLEPKPGQRWLDLGCGSGQLTRMLWKLSEGRIGAVVGLDVAAINDEIYHKLRSELQAGPEQIRFQAGDFQSGLSTFPTGHFDGVVSGLAIQYAESYSAHEQRWTCAGYDQTLAEVHRVLKPGGRFVFSVNLPNPKWSRVGIDSIKGIWKTSAPFRYLRNIWRMGRYGKWLTRESQRGRFHYLPLETIQAKLAAIGYSDIDHRLSYAKQAYIIRCSK